MERKTTVERKYSATFVLVCFQYKHPLEMSSRFWTRDDTIAPVLSKNDKSHRNISRSSTWIKYVLYICTYVDMYCGSIISIENVTSIRLRNVFVFLSFWTERYEMLFGWEITTYVRTTRMYVCKFCMLGVNFNFRYNSYNCVTILQNKNINITIKVYHTFIEPFNSR